MPAMLTQLSEQASVVHIELSRLIRLRQTEQPIAQRLDRQIETGMTPQQLARRRGKLLHTLTGAQHHTTRVAIQQNRASPPRRAQLDAIILTPLAPIQSDRTSLVRRADSCSTIRL